MSRSAPFRPPAAVSPRRPLPERTVTGPPTKGRARVPSHDVTGVSLGRSILVVGVILVVLGLLLSLGPSLPGLFGWMGKLPGDIRIEGARGTFYFPIVTCLVVSVILSILLWLVRR